MSSILYILILILYRVIYKYPSNIYTSLRYVIYYIVYSYKHYSVKSSILFVFTVNKPLVRSFVVNRRYISVFFLCCYLAIPNITPIFVSETKR